MIMIRMIMIMVRMVICLDIPVDDRYSFIQYKE